MRNSGVIVVNVPIELNKHLLLQGTKKANL